VECESTWFLVRHFTTVSRSVLIPKSRRELACACSKHTDVNSCTECISKHLERQISETESVKSGTATPPILHINSNGLQETPVIPHTSSSASSTTTSLEPATSASDRPVKKKRKVSSASSTEPVLETADNLLWRLGSASISEAEVSSYVTLTNIDNLPSTPCGEYVSRAWEMCINFARQSNQKLKYGRFLRFLSLCFFLIWERYSDKQGKSAAREVNAVCTAE
jgi:hypothetical protein